MLDLSLSLGKLASPMPASLVPAPRAPFQEITPPLSPDQAAQEAARCLFCYDAPCIAACPTEIDIPRFIQRISTGDTVGAIQSISATIGQISEIATTIASAVEEQGAATQEIARNIQQAAAGTQEVSGNIAGVTQAASETGVASNQVLTASGELSRQSESLRGHVSRFLAAVRAA